ncbi:hypothetical protein N7530_003913 [Penicillium desertorum]|uniref:Uncharacterized protein n=1 Tax=Penicillium desertorum TaxID=1303715 RepID=A0A9W9WX57_9EURO|nr:hypothetical protein N7530_003913 [Penicillium desertorum]
MPLDLNRLETDVHFITDARKTTRDNVHRNSLAHGPDCPTSHLLSWIESYQNFGQVSSMTTSLRQQRRPGMITVAGDGTY